MKRVLTAVVLVPVVLLILFMAPNWLYSGFIGLIAVLAIDEYFGIAKKYQPNLHRYVVEVAVGLYFLGLSLNRIYAFGILDFGNKVEGLTFVLTSYLVLPLLLLVIGLFYLEIRDALPAAAISYLGFLYIAVTLGEIALAGHQGDGRILVFIFLLVVWSGDIFAYYVGRSYGKHKLAPNISPKKTWEGAIASLAGATLVSLILFRNLHQLVNLLANLDAIPSQSVMYTATGVYAAPWWLAAAFGVCINIAAQLGDLVESALKRGAGVKDSGTLLPGHGGILDRIDAMLLAAPVLWFFYPLLYKAINTRP